MATIEQGILGPFSGHIGSIIGYIRNGQFCIRSMPAHYRDRRSPLQLQNRSRFSMVMKMMSLVRPAISLGFKQFASDMTEMNRATRVNYYSLVKTQNKRLFYDFSGLILSQGPVEPLSNLIISSLDASFTLLWDSQNVLGGNLDNVSVLLINSTKMEMKFHRNAALRCQGQLSLPLPSRWKNDTVYCYTMIQRNNDWSNSSFVGQLQHPSNQHYSQKTDQPSETKSITATPNPQLLSNQTPVKLLFLSPLTTPENSSDPPPNTPN